MKKLIITLASALCLFSCKKTESVVPSSPTATIAPLVDTISFSKSDSIFYSAPPSNDNLTFFLSNTNVWLGSKVVIKTPIKAGQKVCFIANNFTIQNLPYLPTTASFSTFLVIVIYPFSFDNSVYQTSVTITNLPYSK